MKKITFYLLATLTVITAGCSKDAGVDLPTGGGKYTLPEISATLDDTDNGTRTSLGTNQVVNWSNKDRIAIINTRTNTIYQYELVSGVGSPIGQFVAVGAAAAFDAMADLKAVYPAVAATVDNGAIAFSINTDVDEDRRTEYGITAWTKDSPYAFTYNDIKVSYNTPEYTSGDAAAKVNFKFKQLATWCNFTFDFSQTEYAKEQMKSLTVTTTAGSKRISGKTTVDCSNAAAPVVGTGSETSVDWTFNAPVAMSAPVSRSLMLLPVVNNDQLKITVETDFHTFVFYATPQTALEAGMVLRFPIEVNKNFTAGPANTDFAYTVTENAGIMPYYYYGSANCYLAMNGSANIDVTRYRATQFCEMTFETTTAIPAATKAELLWKESSITAIDIPATISGDSFTVSGITGEGNAVVAIKDDADNILWSYHIWVPETNPTENLLTYGITNSGTYQVMPMPLGATKRVTNANTLAEKAAGIGLYYQWGRKDPLGRVAGFATSGSELRSDAFVAAVDAQGNPIAWTGDAYVVDQAAALASYDESAMTMDHYMIDYATKHPAQFIKISGNANNNDWAGVSNPNLWSNPEGYNYPKASDVKKSIYDPCPKGYRVAPKDLFINFSTTKNNTSTTNDPSKETFNASNVSSFSTDKGYDFYIAGTKEGATDFYLVSGYRHWVSGALTGVGWNGYSWSSAPYGSGSASAGILNFYATFVNPLNGSYRAHGFPVRCVRE